MLELVKALENKDELACLIHMENIENINLRYGAKKRTLLMEACQRGLYSVVDRSIDLGADVNANSEIGCQPLHIALMAKHLDCAELLLLRGGDVQCRSAQGTPLYIAVRKRWEQAVRLLVSHGADLNAQSPYSGETVLHLACREGYEDMVALLLELGADPGVLDGAKESPVYTALTHKHTKCAKLLWT